MTPSRTRGSGVLAVLLLVGCSNAPSTSPTAARSSVAPSSVVLASPTATPDSTPSPAPTPTPTPDPAKTAIDGFAAWVHDPNMQLVLEVDGQRRITTTDGIPLYGLILVHGSDTYQLVGADSGVIGVYERATLGERTTRSIGLSYKPVGTTLPVPERFHDALTASTGWTDVGAETRDGATVRHLVAGVSGLTDASFVVDPLPSNAPAELRSTPRLEAWVSALGTPEEFSYTSDAYLIHFHVAEATGVSVSDETAPLARHTAPKYGVSFDVPSTMTFSPTAGGEVSGPGATVIELYCQTKIKGGLEAWAGDGIKYYTDLWGDPGTVIDTKVARDGPKAASAIRVIQSTWTDKTDAAYPVAIVNAAFDSGKYSCDLQSKVEAAFTDAGHARFDRLLLTLKVAR